MRERFSTPIGRGEAIVTSFMFVLLTPLALAAFAGLVAFVGAIVAGILRTSCRSAICPSGSSSATAYVGVVVIGVWLARAYWTGPAYEFVGLIAKAILIATRYQPGAIRRSAQRLLLEYWHASPARRRHLRRSLR